MSEEERIPSKRPGPKPGSRVGVRVIDDRTGEPPLGEAGERGWDDGEEPGVVEVVEEVTKLPSERGPLSNRRVEDEVQVTPEPEPQRKLSMFQMTLLMGAAALLLVVVPVAAVILVRKNVADKRSEPLEQPVAREPLESEVYREMELEIADAKRMVEEALAIFVQYSKAESLDEVRGLLRNAESLGPVLEERWEPFRSGENLNAKVARDGSTTFIVMKGVDAEGSAYEFVLMPGEGGMKVDWEASLGIGEVDFEELERLGTGRSVWMRVSVGLSGFHPLEYPDDEFFSYRLAVPGTDDAFFGFAPIGSEVAEALNRALNLDAVLVSQIPVAAMILELRDGGRGSWRQFQITRVLQKGWIQP